MRITSLEEKKGGGRGKKKRRDIDEKNGLDANFM